ncbi:MAG: reverse transcriptase domain-containing protein [Planctomycetia bacterium]|nr:reverse transcriptase domain-containing protein [Planctomycetia bacterium]
MTKFDRELEKRGHKFVRYADDCNIYVKRQRAAERVMVSAMTFLEKRLRLTVNRTNSQIGSRTRLKFLGFCFGKLARSRGFAYMKSLCSV